MSIKQLIQPKEKDLGAFSVRRLLPRAEQKMVGPWIFFDHMGPAEFAPGQGVDVRPHPHINLATVTYLFEGEILHRDSLGSEQAIQPGDINLMVAGKGITHSERERPDVRNQAHRLHGLQLWHVLPEADEQTEPAFYHYPEASIPSFQHEGNALRLMMGEAYGERSPVKTFADTLYVEAFIKQGNQLTLPDVQECAIYVVSGQVVLAEQEIPQFSMAVLSDNSVGELRVSEDSRVAIIGGEKMLPRFIEWNFVSSQQSRIQQAVEDWRAGRFAKVIGDEEEYIPY